jgi:hypothetical protein
MKKKNSTRIDILKKIKSIPFGSTLFREGRDCPICMEQFQKVDKVF